MKKIKHFNQLLLLVGMLSTFVLGCNKTDDPVDDVQRAGTMKDIDGNTYKTVKIGSQVWMAENLKTTKYNNGDEIIKVTSDEWGCNNESLQGAYCNYDDLESYVAAYGRLYNWYAVNTGILAPEGWHVPTEDDWEQLSDYLGGESVAGGKLKESGIKHWSSPNSGATNETGFTALPGGGRNYCYGFADVVGIYGHWWSSTERDESDAFGSAYGRSLRYESSSLERHYTKGGSDYYFKGHWFSVRLIKD